ncbi:hypothetical protein EK21DRAFT_117800 [Setomelanomma holmii]|uniref:Uncharacterized protein n=1 Tax=Setomelanomma holmii TaxID=210430 RepID=A0A9P4GYJ9_9PLEO|nr:hypothetical protein EK21DRAFT_117800 [Setomelanomma holmii]
MALHHSASLVDIFQAPECMEPGTMENMMGIWGVTVSADALLRPMPEQSSISWKLPTFYQLSFPRHGDKNVGQAQPHRDLDKIVTTVLYPAQMPPGYRPRSTLFLECPDDSVNLEDLVAEVLNVAYERDGLLVSKAFRIPTILPGGGKITMHRLAPEKTMVSIIGPPDGSMDYQAALMLLEQQNKKRLLMARQAVNEDSAKSLTDALGPGQSSSALQPFPFYFQLANELDDSE